MAAKQKSEVVIVAKYSKQRSQVDARSNETIKQVTERFERNLKVPTNSLRILHQGAPLPEHTLVKDAFKEMNAATVVHLVENSGGPQLSLAHRRREVSATHMFGDEKIIIYCKTCDVIAEGRPTLMCLACRSLSSFERKDTSPISTEDLYKTKKHIVGKCHDCKKEDATATLMFECKAGDAGTSHTGAFLKDFHYNRHGIICMKCGVVRKDELVYVFNCSEHHVMCLICFQGFCVWNLQNSMFRNYDNAGFSIACPASNCNRVPVLDPHHFCAAGKKFYSEYHERAITDYQESCVCMDCKCAIDYSTVDRTPPPSEQPGGVSSGWFYGLLKLFGYSRTQHPTPSRSKVKCGSGCDRWYCSGCRALWHEGDCAIDVNDSTDFPIDEEWMRKATWPK